VCKWEARFFANQSRNCAPRLSINLVIPTHPSASQKTLPVHTPSPPAPCPMRLRTRFSHKSSALHRPFLVPSGNLGKLGSHLPSLTPLIQNSSIPQPQFRKLSHPSTPSQQSSSPKYPLFLPERRVLLSISLITYPFSSFPSRFNRHSEFLGPPLSQRSDFLRLGRVEPNLDPPCKAQTAQESREAPPFSTRTTTPT
jgi:hypothetical protein